MRPKGKHAVEISGGTFSILREGRCSWLHLHLLRSTCLECLDTIPGGTAIILQPEGNKLEDKGNALNMGEPKNRSLCHHGVAEGIPTAA